MPDTTTPTRPSRRPTVLVTGATGNLGREVVDRLRTQGARVRCLVRDLAGAPPEAEPVTGDLTNPAALRQALDGVDAVFLIWPLLDSAPAHGLIAELAAAAPRLVHLSSAAVEDGSAHQTDPIVQVHADMEALLHGVGLRPVVLRSDTLASNARGWKRQLAAGDVVSGPQAARTAVVDERDVADAAVAVLLADHADRDHGPYVLTGPEILGRAEQVAQLGAALRRDLRFEALPAARARARMLADGLPEPLADALVAAAERRPDSRRVTDHVRRLTGHPAGTFARWAADHAAEFGRREP
ncbi:SDR family oxidoreductase [Streptomyces sp. NRRL B-3253]|uniref:SDR family oxidoreductase n=1 Tax=Streptomyces sp. NRRL B-3253 TaxID=1463837 RepID=UPI0004CCB052|nr:NAD(P)H-binding protein [Streptomyces sp. NRRL B-3253]